MAEHSRFGGSSCARYLACAGSVPLAASLPVQRSSSYADAGSAAHALAALCLSRDEHPINYEGETLPDWPEHPVTEEMCDAVVVYLNAVLTEISQTKDSEFYVEKGFDLPLKNAAKGEVFGTNDAIVWHPSTGRLRVFDFKYGAGVSVYAEDNAQLKFYAAGAVFANPDWKVREVVLTIVQPRAIDAGETQGVRNWSFEVVDLLDFVAEVDAAVVRVKKVEDIVKTGLIPFDKLNPGFPPFVTGSHCKFCDAAPACPAREREILEAARLDLASVADITVDDLPIVSNLDPDHLGQVLKAGSLLADWLGTVQEYVEALLMAGTPVKGWKVVEKIGRSKWVAAEEDVVGYAEMLFGVDRDAMFPRKLTTIGDAEKLLKAAGAMKTEIDTFKMKFTVKDSSGLTIAPESDRRPAVNAVERDFKDVALPAAP